METKLPRAVREAGERSEKALKNKVAQGKPGDAGKPAAEDDAGKGKPAAPAAATPSVAELQAQLDKLTQKYETLQGKYNAEVKAGTEPLERMNADLQSQLQAMQTQLQTIQGELDTAKAEKQAVNEHLENIRTEYGADHDLVLALSEQQKTIDSLNTTVKKLQTQLTGVTTDLNDTKTQSATDRKTLFYDALDEKVPNWETINKDIGWKKWLGMVDPFTGKRRQDLLDQAHRDLDAQRVINFFNAYGEFKASNKQPSIDDNIADLADAGGSGGADGGGAQKRTWTAAQIRQLYVDRAKGKVSDADFKAAEADLLAAQSEGRLR